MWRKPSGSGTGEGGNVYNGTYGKGGAYSVMPIASMTDKRTADKRGELSGMPGRIQEKEVNAAKAIDNARKVNYI